MNKTSIIIVTFNSARTIKNCLNSIMRSSTDCEIIVVDNNSEDETVKIIQRYGKKVNLIEAGANLGFAKANNLGVKSATGEYIIFLNPDTEVWGKDSLNKLRTALEENPEYGIIGPKLVYPDGTPQNRVRNLPTVFRAFKEYILGNKGEYDFYSPNCKTLCEVESIIGACMVVKKELFEKVGGFNEKYFMYFEDLELCKEIKSRGFKIGFLPEVTIEHAEGKSGLNQKTFKLLQISSKQYHGLLNYFLINTIIRLSSKKNNIFWLFMILFGAAFFRIFFLDLIEFKLDEALTVFQTVQFYSNPYLIQRGLISGIGVYNFPLFNYLIIILSVFSRDPQFLSFFIALINTILVPIFYLIIRKYYDQITSIFAGFLLAFSPWAIIFSRKIWAQDLILLLLIPLFGLLHELIIRKKTNFTLPIFIILTLLTQLHASGLFLSVASVLIFILLRVKINIQKAILGVVIGIILMIPYFAFQLSSNPICSDCEAFFKYQNMPRTYDVYDLIRPFQLMNGQGYHFILGNSYDDFASFFPFLNTLKYFFLLSFLIPLAGIFFILTKKRNYLFIILYLTIIPLLYFVTRTISYMHYFVILIPFVVILYALSFSSLYDLTKKTFFKTIICLIFAIFILANIIFLYSFNQYLSSAKVIKGDYGPIYALTKQVVNNEIGKYNSLSYYNELKSYTYVAIWFKDFHTKLGEFFLSKGDQSRAAFEFNSVNK